MSARELALVAMVGVAFAYAARTSGKPMTQQEVRQIAEAVIAGEGWAVDPCMIVTMAYIESGFKPSASRFEPHLGEASAGLMQVLPSTAKWLHDDLGYRRYSPNDLYNPVVSIYFGAAFVRWLSNYSGRARSEQWVVESYNGGPGNSNSGTRNHWSKYQAAKAQICQ